MINIAVYVGVIEKILNEGLCVLTPLETSQQRENNLEGEALCLLEISEEPTNFTGRAFFARGAHDLGSGFIQIMLLPFMEDNDPDTGARVRIPLAGSYASEKHTLPKPITEDTPFYGTWEIKTKGEKPLWVYCDAKWISELSISSLLFNGLDCKTMVNGAPTAPAVVTLKVQGQGGEKRYEYEYLGPVK